MPTSYTSLLGLALPATGELQGTWGTTVNDSITSLVDSAVAGTTILNTDADVTLTATTGSANQSRQAIILWTANGSVTRNITAPAQSKAYVVINNSAGTQSIVIRGVGPTAGVTVIKGERALVAWNGSDFVKVGSGGSALPIAEGGTGQTTQQAAINALAGAVTSGQYLRGNGTNVLMSAIQAGDVPTLNQNTTGTASNVTGTVAIANGGTGATTAPTARTNLGATTVGGNLFTLANPSAVTFPRFNADNTVSALDAATFRSAIGAGTGSGSVTSVGATSPVASSGGTAPSISLNSAYGDTLNPYGTKTANQFLAAPNGASGAPSFRAIVAADIPTLNQNTTGTASNVTGTVSIGNGGTGATTAANARANLDVPTRTGGDASGTWSINITGSAGSASTASTANALATGNNYQMNSLGVGTGPSGTAGEIRATNNVTAYYSDERLKTHLGDIKDALAKVCTLSGFYYEANEVAQQLGYQPIREVGVSAQQVQAVLPEVVAPAPIDDKYLTVRYEKLVPLLIEAIKELAGRVEALEKGR